MKSKFILYSSLSMFILTAIACQSAGPLSNLFATVTPTVTITPSPTSTPTNTPSPTPLPSGIHFEEQSDQSTRVVDYDGGYSLVLSADWIALPGDAESLKDAVETMSESNPEVLDMMKYIDVIDNDALRMMAFNKNDDYREGTLFPNLLALTLQDKLAGSLPMEMLVELNVEQLKQVVSISEVISSTTDFNQNGVEYGHIEIKTSLNQNGRPVEAWQNLILLSNGRSMTLFNLTLPLSKKEAAETLVPELIDSIEKLDGK